MSSDPSADDRSRLRAANLLGAVATEIAVRLESRAKRHANATGSVDAALNVIGLYEGCTNGELGAALGLSHTATVRCVDKLEAEQWAVRETGTDKRSVALRLTETGRLRAQATMRDRCEFLAGFVDALTPEQRSQLECIAETLLRASVQAAKDAWFICRLCDPVLCPPDACPVHQKAIELEPDAAG